MNNNTNRDELSEDQKPYLLRAWSKCSEFSEIDIKVNSPPRGIKLRKLNSTLEPQDLDELLQRPIVPLLDNSELSPLSKGQPCSCTKTHCLKMYCSCFHNGRVCGDACKCDSCHNKEEYKSERQSAVQHIRNKAHRNKKVSEDKIFETKDVWGCNCKKTRCQKRYCECYIRGKTCTVECNCNQCENGKDEDLYNEIRRQNERPRHTRRQR